MKKDSFILYTRFYKPIQRLTNEQLGRLFRALFEYNSTDESISVDEDIEVAFGFFSNQMDMDNTKWMEKVEKLRANARASKSKQLQANATKSKQIALVNVNENVNVNVSKESIKKGANAPAPQRFIKPSIQEVAAYAAAQGYGGFSAERFFAYYESNGWKVGRNPMKSWKNAVTSWHFRDQQKDQPKLKLTYDDLHPIGDFTNERTVI